MKSTLLASCFWARLFVALPLLGSTAPLLLPRPAFSQPLPERRVISGRVTRGDGTGVARAVVKLLREQQEGAFAYWGAETATDAKGYFSFPDAEDGAYFISVEAESFAPIQSRPLTVSEGSSTWNARLEQLAVLPLRLRTADGAVLGNARVIVRLASPEKNFLSLRKSDESGAVTLRELPPGRFSLEVAAPGGFASLREVDVRYAAKPAPLEVRLARGGGLKIIARDANTQKPLGGATVRLDATLPPNEEDRRAGKLADRVLPNVQGLYAYSTDGSGAVTRDESGVLEMRDLPPGKYRAKLVLPGYDPSETREVEVKAGEDALVEMPLSPRGTPSNLRVRLVDKSNKPLVNRDWTLQLRSLGQVAGVPGGDLVPEENVAEAGGFGVLARRARSDDKGEITLFPLRPGRWRVLAFPTREGGEAVDKMLAQGDATVEEAGGQITLTFAVDVP